MYIARDKSIDGDGDSDYWLSLQALDRDYDPEDGTVEWIPIESESCASIGAKVWEKLGGPILEPGEDQQEIDIKFIINKEV